MKIDFKTRYCLLSLGNPHQASAYLTGEEDLRDLYWGYGNWYPVSPRSLILAIVLNNSRWQIASSLPRPNDWPTPYTSFRVSSRKIIHWEESSISYIWMLMVQHMGLLKPKMDVLPSRGLWREVGFPSAFPLAANKSSGTRDFPRFVSSFYISDGLVIGLPRQMFNRAKRADFETKTLEIQSI